MSGHSQFKNIMARKGAQDKRKAKVFSKLAKEITIAAKSGLPDPQMNPRLRLAIQNARAENMPKDNIERAIKKADAAGDGSEYFEIRYEGYAPGSIAVIVETLTDNKNRTASNVRSIFTKYGGNLGETGSVAYNFERVGYIEYPLSVASTDAMFEAAIEAGGNDISSDEEKHFIETLPDDLAAVTEGLETKFGTPNASRLEWKAVNKTEIKDLEKAKSFMNFIEILEDDDDVQRIFYNAEISEDILNKMD